MVLEAIVRVVHELLMQQAETNLSTMHPIRRYAFIETAIKTYIKRVHPELVIEPSSIVYDVQSPDGFSIHSVDTYTSIAEAADALDEWIKRYKEQGYYSSNKGRLTLEEALQECTILEIDSPFNS